MVGVDTFERGGEMVRIALAALLAVADDVEAGALLVADRQQRRVVLGGLRCSSPTSQRSRARTRGTCFESLARSISHSGCG